MNLAFTENIHEIERYLTSIQKKKMPGVIQKALNKTVGNAKTLAKKELAEDMKIPKKMVEAKGKGFGLKITKKAFKGSLSAEITAKGGRVNLMRLGAKELLGGRYAVKWGSGNTTDRAFISQFGSNKPAVFKKVEGKTSKGNRKIRGAFGPGFAASFDKEEIKNKVINFWVEKLKKEISRLVKLDIFGITKDGSFVN